MGVRYWCTRDTRGISGCGDDLAHAKKHQMKEQDSVKQIEVVSCGANIGCIKLLDKLCLEPMLDSGVGKREKIAERERIIQITPFLRCWRVRKLYQIIKTPNLNPRSYKTMTKWPYALEGMWNGFLWGWKNLEKVPEALRIGEVENNLGHNQKQG